MMKLASITVSCVSFHSKTVLNNGLHGFKENKTLSTVELKVKLKQNHIKVNVLLCILLHRFYFLQFRFVLFCSEKCSLNVTQTL